MLFFKRPSLILFLFTVPPEKFMLGCVFFVVEYDKTDAPDVDITAWETIIKDHGGEVESNYTHR